MLIKTFRAPTFREAIDQVRAEFGPAAAVLHTREVRLGLLRGWRGRSVVEVAATPDASPLAERAAASGAIDGGAHLFNGRPDPMASPTAEGRRDR